MSQTTIFHIPALDCPDELTLVERSLRQTPGISQLRPDYLGRKLRVEFDPERTTTPDILKAIEAAGFPAQVALPLRQGNDSNSEYAHRASRLGTYFGGVLLLAAGLSRLVMRGMDWPVAVLAIVSTVVSGLPVARTAYRALRLRALDMNVLMCVAGAGAIAIGDYFEAATAMFLFGVSLWLERLSLRRRRRGIRSLMDLTPQVAHRIASPSTTEGPASVIENVTDVDPIQLNVGDQVLVRPGERIPTDGTVVSGESAVNQAPITGESLPADKAPGNRVFAGTLNGEGSLVIAVTKAAGDTTLAQIERLIEDARASRSPTERFVDAFARHYTPAVILLAAMVVIGPIMLAQFGVEWANSVPPSAWLERGLVLLVIACPCALVISTPVAIVSALYRATQLGILVKGGEFLEKAASIQVLALDKTGTVTTGSMDVVQVESFNGQSTEGVLRIAASLEQSSEHPLAAAIVASAKRREIDLGQTPSITTERGLGVHGNIDGEEYFLGRAKLFSDARIRLTQADAMRLISPPQDFSSSNTLNSNVGRSSGEPAGVVAVQTPAATTVWLGTAQRLVGVIRLADHPRPDVRQALAELRQLGVQRIVMLTGDNALAARAMAREIGIDDVEADLLPQDKIDKVRALSTTGSVAMVGDGVNDAPALAAADIGIALGGQSSDTALETADVVIMAASLKKIPELIRLSRRCRQLLRQNISFALASKLAVMILAVAGLASMWMAVAADVGASMIVIANGMRTLNRPGISTAKKSQKTIS